MKKRILSVILSLALCLGLCPPMAFAEETSLDVSQNSVVISTGGDYTITGSTTTNTITVDSGVTANITLSGVNIDVSATSGAAAFKIADDSAGNVSVTLVGTNTLKSGANCAGLQKGSDNTKAATEAGTLTIDGNGSLTATGGAYGAGIGGGHGKSGYNITINGGTVKASGKSSTIYPGAGIGGGYTGSADKIIINGGNVAATGGQGSEYGMAKKDGAAGIGGGWGGKGGTIVINGGIVNAVGGYSSAGIGAGYSGGNSNADNNITITGGTVTAKGGAGDKEAGAGIGGRNRGGATVTISGGTVTATGGGNAAGIGDGEGATISTFSADGSAWINASNIGARTKSITSAVIFQGTQGQVYGNPALSENAEIPSGATLAIPADTTLTVNSGATLTVPAGGALTLNGGSLTGEGTLTGTGTFLTENLTEDMICLPGGKPLYYNGQDRSEHIKPLVKIIILGQEFTLEGWGEPTVKASGLNGVENLMYEITYTKDSETVTASIMLEPSGTNLTATLADNKTEYEYGETVTINATVTPTGEAPAMLADAGDTPTDFEHKPGWVAVYKGDEFLVAAEPGSDGTYGIHVPSRKLGAGTHTLTVKYNGTDYMADSTGAVDVTVNQKVLTPTITGTTEKVYDGTTAAPAGLSIKLEGVVGSDVVSAEVESYTYDSADAGDNKTITATGVTLSGDAAGNYALPDTITIAGKITKSQPTIAFNGYPTTATYSGTALANPTEAQLTLTGAAYSDVKFTWSADPLNAGTYTLTATIDATANTEAASATQDVIIGPKEVARPTITLSESTYEYDGTEKKPGVTVKDGNTVIDPKEYTVTYANNTNVGTSTVTITDKDGGNYIVSGEGSFEITKVSQAKFSITNKPNNIVYGDSFTLGTSGGSGNGDVTWAVTKGTATVTTDGKVTVTGVGEITITATKAGDTNYKDATASISFTSGQKELTVTEVTAENRTYDGTATVEITGATLNGAVGNDNVSVNTTNLTGTIGGTDVGDYTSITLPEMSLSGSDADKYTLIRPTGAVSTNVKISKAAALTTKSGNLAVVNGKANEYTFGLGALLPSVPGGMNLGGTVTYILGAVNLGDYYTSGAKIEGQTLTLPIKEVQSTDEKLIGTITITISSKNFEDMTAAINVQSTNKIVPTGAPTLSAPSLTYGQPLSTITLSGSLMDGNTSVPGTFVWSHPQDCPTAQDSYSAAWVFTPTDGDTYATANGTSSIKVNPASITGAEITLDKTTFRADGITAHTPKITGVKLGDTTLTENDYTAEIPSAKDAGTYKVTITGKGNYTGMATAEFTINPVNNIDLNQKDDQGNVLRLEVETGLSEVPAALKGKPEFDTAAEIETALRTAVENVMSNPEKQIEVLDVRLQYEDNNNQWHDVDPNNFPQDGVTTILPYPDETKANPSGYTFTVQHLISSGKEAGTMETLAYTQTGNGLQCTFNSLSPVAIGYQKKSNSGDTGGTTTPSTPAVTVTIDGDKQGGKVEASQNSVTITPEEGYKIAKITVNGREVSIPASNILKGLQPTDKVVVTFAKIPANPVSERFTDVKAGAWYEDAVQFAVDKGLFLGMTKTTFAPDNPMNRGMLATVLYRLAQEPDADPSNLFNDVAGGEYYAEAVAWAASKDIISGYGNGKFGPNDDITREQLAAMLWRYAGKPASANKVLNFNDASQTSDWALDAMRWAVENGIVNGHGNGRLDPKGQATRAQVAQMLMRYVNLTQK